MLKLSSKSYVTVNGAAMAPQAARARGAICPLKSTRMVAKMTSNHFLPTNAQCRSPWPYHQSFLEEQHTNDKSSVANAPRESEIARKKGCTISTTSDHGALEY